MFVDVELMFISVKLMFIAREHVFPVQEQKISGREEKKRLRVAGVWVGQGSLWLPALFVEEA